MTVISTSRPSLFLVVPGSGRLEVTFPRNGEAKRKYWVKKYWVKKYWIKKYWFKKYWFKEITSPSRTGFWFIK